MANGYVTAREVMLRLEDHIKVCTSWNRLVVGFIAAVFLAVVTFAGYSYVQSQTLDRELDDAKMATVQAVHQSANEAADKVQHEQQGN